MRFIKLGEHFVNLDRVVSISHVFKNNELMLLINDGSIESVTAFPTKKELEILEICTGINLREGKL